MKKSNEQLIAEFQAGDASALDVLLEQNQGLICKVAWKAANTSVEEFDDIYQELQIVFCRSVEMFDAEKGVRFSTFVVTNMQFKATALWRARGAQKRSAVVFSLNAPVGEDGQFLDSLSSEAADPDEIATFNSEVDFVHEAMRRLDERSREIVSLRIRDWTLEEVGEKFGITRERVRQIEVKALGKIRKLCNPGDDVSKESPEPSPECVISQEPIFRVDPYKSSTQIVRENEGLIVRMFLDGKLPREIGDKLGVHNDTIRSKLKKLGMYYDCRHDRRKKGGKPKNKFERYRDRLREKGFCSICPTPPVAGSVYCEYHREKRREYCRRKRERRNQP